MLHEDSLLPLTLLNPPANWWSWNGILSGLRFAYCQPSFCYYPIQESPTIKNFSETREANSSDNMAPLTLHWP
jgi:hypothetical protein